MRSSGLPRWVEVPLAGAALLLSAPLILLGAAAIVMTSGRPAVFRQQRVGRRGRAFTMLKLRTMAVNGRGPAVTAAGDLRITRVGALLRGMKVDELPELWNVVRGEMRLVGPRPEVPALVDLADPLWVETLSSAPGITDPVTLRLRDEEGILRAAGENPEDFYRRRLQPYKLRGYVKYQHGRTWRTDLAVLFQTVAAVVRLPGTVADPADILRELAEANR